MVEAAVTLGELREAQKAHAILDDVRFASTNESNLRIELAIADHARNSAELSERTNVRTHERIDKLVESIDKFSSDLHSRINGLLLSIILVTMPVIGWLVIQVYNGIKAP